MSGNSGNARDNRQRGNAAQLLEKYKNMARDAQLAGDRVQTEYYLQFADHYFRVLDEGRARYEEQRRQRGDDDDGDDGDDIETAEADGESEDRPQRRPRREREDRPERAERSDRADRGERNERRPRGNGRDRDEGGDEGETISAHILPPAIGTDDEGEGEAPKPRRRAVRRPKAEDSDSADA